jgi:hypothetical protein
MSALRIFEEKIVLCKKGDEITGLDGISSIFLSKTHLKTPISSNLRIPGESAFTHASVSVSYGEVFFLRFAFYDDCGPRLQTLMLKSVRFLGTTLQ